MGLEDANDLLDGSFGRWRHPSQWHLGFTRWEINEINDGRLPIWPQWEQDRRNTGDYGRITCYQARWCAAHRHWQTGPGITFAENGNPHIVAHCLRCGQVTHNPIVARSPKQYDLSTLPIVSDNRERYDAHQCERCEAREAEWHHWAPRHLFDDSDTWPGSWLCRHCHRQWHTIVTPHMGRRVS